MIDLKLSKWDLHPKEEKVINWLDEHGYDVVLIKQHLSKLVLQVSKNGLMQKFEIPKGVTDVDGYMSLFEKSFELASKIEEIV